MSAFATRSLTEPVGLAISSLAKSRTAGFGDIRAISTSGVCPIASTMSGIGAHAPPAIAGRMTSSSRGSTGVAVPPR